MTIAVISSMQGIKNTVDLRRYKAGMIYNSEYLLWLDVYPSRSFPDLEGLPVTLKWKYCFVN